MDMGASVIARLKNKAKETENPPIALRFLSGGIPRGCISAYAENLVLKAAVIYTDKL